MPSKVQSSTAIQDRARTLRARIPRASYPRLRAFVSSVRLAVAVAFAGFTSVFFLAPGVSLVRELADPELGGPGIPAEGLERSARGPPVGQMFGA